MTSSLEDVFIGLIWPDGKPDTGLRIAHHDIRFVVQRGDTSLLPCSPGHLFQCYRPGQAEQRVVAWLLGVLFLEGTTQMAPFRVGIIS